MTLYVGPYRGFSGTCAGHAQPGAVALMSWFLGAYGSRGGTNLGIYGCRPIAGTAIGSVHGDGRAGDLGNPVGAAWAQDLANWLMANSAELGVQCVIHNRKIWSSTYARDGWKPYNGVDPHTGHIHVELTWAAAASLTVARINAIAAGWSTGLIAYLVFPDSSVQVTDGISRRPFNGTGDNLKRFRSVFAGPDVAVSGEAEAAWWGSLAAEAGGDHRHTLEGTTTGGVVGS